MLGSILRWTLTGATVAVLMPATPADLSAQIDVEALQDEAVEWLQEYIRLNTINPPGNETLGAAFFAQILTPHHQDRRF